MLGDPDWEGGIETGKGRKKTKEKGGRKTDLSGHNRSRGDMTEKDGGKKS